MKRLRWTLLLLALGIALPAALIIQRAVASLELENTVRHEAVGERVFDEMERSLSDFLLREESRSPSDYEHTSEPGVLPAEFANATEPFIVGWFVLDAGGDTRLITGDSGDPARVARGMRDALRARSALELDEAVVAADAGAPAPGRTQSVGRDRAQLETAGKKDRAESSAYGVLQSLNRAQELRSERQSKALAKRSSAAAPRPASPRAQRAQAAPPESLRSLDYADLDAEAFAEEGLADDRSSPADIRSPQSVDPLIGRTTRSGDIVLVRSVWQDDDVERQGLVLDRPSLVGWLEERVLADTGLASRVRIDFGAPGLPAPADAPHRYLHRFAEPFEALVARLELEPLPGLASTRPIYALAALLAAVAAIGLVAVYRMTRVVVDYAQRRSDFVAAVSHELKTPLTSIRMYAEMLRDGLVSSDQKRDEYHATIADESERLSRLIDNVLEFSRLEQNQRDLSLVVGGLSDAIRAAAEKLGAHVEREGFHLKLDLPDGLPPVRYDRDAVTQLVFNLVDNALKYARHSETREIEIGLASAGGRIELRVRDFGPGVPEDQLRRVFEPFYRIGEELTRTSDGTGIGLALVKELSERMGAVVSGRNATGGGFEVRIAFAATP